ncbi:Hypothetical_protein [Hexamita inflata]|uniref:Hypothetical_protein n=1 Tax=Hexamita inflata TaxID=28002 RepID=A0AA86U8Z7_9EUKA|nr:Hypothetical protein HINF_LOCUS29702 [Hexamita inflata]
MSKGCCHQKYCCVLTWFCFMFLSMLVAGITLACIETQFEFPIYYEDQRGDLQHSWSYDNYYYMNVGTGVTLAIVGFFGMLITFSFCCVLNKKTEVEYEQLAVHPVPQFVQPQMNYVPQQQYPIPQYQGMAPNQM